MDSLLNGDYTAETTEDYGTEIPNLPYPDIMGKRNEEEHRQGVYYGRFGDTPSPV